jgi:DNA repair protein RadD
MDPRWYQSQSVDSAWQFMREKPGNPCVVLPTGAGKSLVIAMIARDVLAWKGRCLVLAHRKELLQQNAEKIEACIPGLQAGIYSAGIGRRDYLADVVVAGIQSVYKQKAAYQLGHRDVVVVDEAHLIPGDGEGMYFELFDNLKKINPNIRFVGLTATPYRLDHGMVVGEGRLFAEICYEVPLLELIKQGFLCPLTSKEPGNLMQVADVGTRGGEFIQSQLDRAAAQDETVRQAVEELLSWSADRRSVLIFTCGRRHAALVEEHLAKAVGSAAVGYVDGTTKPAARQRVLDGFKAGSIRFLINIDVLTTGFDAPNIDCVALLRPTLSPGLLYQMIGRGFRLHPSKQNCLVLDFAGNIERHGPVDRLRPPKTKGLGAGSGGEAPARACPKCKELVAIQVRECPACGYQWPEPEARHDAKASTLPVLSDGSPAKEDEWIEVLGDPAYLVYSPPGKKRSLRVIYKLRGTNAFSEFLSLDHPHDSAAKKQAERWWRRRSDVPCPGSCWEAWHILKKCPEAVAKPARVLMRWTPGRKFPEIVDVEFHPRGHFSLIDLDEARTTAQVQAQLFRS